MEKQKQSQKNNSVPQPKMINSKKYRDNWDEINWKLNKTPIKKSDMILEHKVKDGSKVYFDKA